MLPVCLVRPASAQQVPLGEGQMPVTPSAGATATGNGLPADVTIIVFPRSNDLARVGLAYHKIIAHKRVREDISRLEREAGWKIGGDVTIEDDRKPAISMLPASAMTIANFTLRNAPQVKEQTPQLLPYLHAFQGWDRVSVSFFIAPLPQYRGVTDFENETLKLTMRTDQGGYTYDAEIRNHNSPLLDLMHPAAPAVVAPALPMKTTSASDSKTLAWTLILAGAGISLGCFLYLLLTRRSAGNVSTPTLRQ